ncbi:MAG TPA: tolB protein [Polyangiaceae bacterium]|nr:tolB protein [Polyangiaceae bacterium]
MIAKTRLLTISSTALASLLAAAALAQPAPPAAPPAGAAPPPDESLLGELPITANVQEHIPKIAILPSLSPDLEDVIVRGVVRRDFELTGLFDVIADSKAPPGLYGFDDPVDIDAWKKLGAEAILKVSARKHSTGKVEVFGLAYFLNVGKDPVYEKKLLVDGKDIRVTAHRVTDALLGALTGRPGGFASHFVFAAPWGRNRRIFSMDSDGSGLAPHTQPDLTAIAPTWGPNNQIFHVVSKNYSPFRLFMLAPGAQPKPIDVPFKTSIYSVAFNKDYTKLAVAVAADAKSAIFVGDPDGSNMTKASNTDLSTHPVFSPSGKVAWIGGGVKQGSQRVFLEGKAISPPGFTAGAPTFCDTEDGVRVVYSVSVGGDRHDLVMSGENGRGMTRLTQNQGSNTAPACSPDGRMIAFFSTRNKAPGMYLISLKRFKTQKLSSQHGESLRWAALPPPPAATAP